MFFSAENDRESPEVAEPNDLAEVLFGEHKEVVLNYPFALIVLILLSQHSHTTLARSC